MGKGCNEISPPTLEELKKGSRQRNLKHNDAPKKEEKKELKKVEVTYPDYMSRTIVSLLVFVMAATMRGGFLLLLPFLSDRIKL